MLAPVVRYRDPRQNICFRFALLNAAQPVSFLIFMFFSHASESTPLEHECDPDSFVDCQRDLFINYSIQYYNKSYPEPFKQTASFCR